MQTLPNDKVLMGTALLLALGFATLTLSAQEPAMTSHTHVGNLLPVPADEETASLEATGWKERVWSGDQVSLQLAAPGRAGGRCFAISSEGGATRRGR